MSKPIKVLHVVTSLSRHGGIEETLRILCQHLDSEVFQIGICTIKDRPQDVLEIFKNMNVQIFYGSRAGQIFDLFTTVWVRSVIKHFQADIVHTHNNKGNFHGRIAGKFVQDISIVTTHHDLGDSIFSVTASLRQKKRDQLEAHSFKYRNWIYSRLYPLLNIQFNLLNDKVIAVSNAVRKVYSVNPQDTFYETVYAPFDHTLFKPGYFGFQHTKVTLGTVGSLVGQKGLFYLLHAMKNLRQYRHDIYLKVIGDGPLKSELEAFRSRHHLESYVGLLGHLPHDANLYKDIDLYIQPSVSEGCSITLLEAMGTGIPVIASNIDGPRELIIPHQTGLLVTPKNVEALTDAIVELIENKEKAFRLGRAGQKRAAENFSAVHFIGKMSRIYQELCRHEA